MLKQKNERHSLKAQWQPILSALESAIKNTEMHTQEMRDFNPIPGEYTTRAGLNDVPGREKMYHELGVHGVRKFWGEDQRWNLNTVYQIYHGWASRISFEENMFHDITGAIMRTTFVTYADATWRLMMLPRLENLELIKRKEVGVKAIQLIAIINRYKG